jgi:lysophospholipase L1-like esterase
MKIYVVGDSISIQYGPYLKKYLNEKIEYSRKEGEEEALLDLDNPQGANGGDSKMVRIFLEALFRSGKIDANCIVLNCGLHDIKTNPSTKIQQIPIEEYEQNLKAIIKLFQNSKIKLIWVRTTPCVDKVHNTPDSKFHRYSNDNIKYNNIADHLMQQANIPMIDLFSFTQKLGPDLYCDHVHFHEHIREKQGAFIAGWLENYYNSTHNF